MKIRNGGGRWIWCWYSRMLWWTNMCEKLLSCLYEILNLYCNARYPRRCACMRYQICLNSGFHSGHHKNQERTLISYNNVRPIIFHERQSCYTLLLAKYILRKGCTYILLTLISLLRCNLKWSHKSMAELKSSFVNNKAFCVCGFLTLIEWSNLRSFRGWNMGKMHHSKREHIHNVHPLNSDRHLQTHTPHGRTTNLHHNNHAIIV